MEAAHRRPDAAGCGEAVEVLDGRGQTVGVQLAGPVGRGRARYLCTAVVRGTAGPSKAARKQGSWSSMGQHGAARSSLGRGQAAGMERVPLCTCKVPSCR